jgi:hypothetical protein
MMAWYCKVLAGGAYKVNGIVLIYPLIPLGYLEFFLAKKYLTKSKAASPPYPLKYQLLPKQRRQIIDIQQ